MLTIDGHHPPSVGGDGLVLTADDPALTTAPKVDSWHGSPDISRPLPTSADSWLGSPGNTLSEVAAAAGDSLVVSGTVLSGTLYASMRHAVSSACALPAGAGGLPVLPALSLPSADHASQQYASQQYASQRHSQPDAFEGFCSGGGGRSKRSQRRASREAHLHGTVNASTVNASCERREAHLHGTNGSSAQHSAPRGSHGSAQHSASAPGGSNGSGAHSSGAHHGAHSSPPSPLSSPVPSPMATGEREYLLGPDAYGRWTPVSVLSIKHKESAVTRAEAGQSATFCLEVRDAKAKLRRGMVLLEQRLPNGPPDETQAGVHQRLPNGPSPYAVPFFASVPPPFMAAHPGKLPGSFPAGVLPGAAVVWELEVSVHALRLPSPVPVGTEIVLHCVGVKQAARLLRVDDAAGTGSLDKLRDGADARLRLRFVHSAEFLQIGMPCILRDASAGASHLGLAIGLVTAASP